MKLFSKITTVKDIICEKCLPRRLRFAFQSGGKEPSIINNCRTSFSSASRRLITSPGEFDRELYVFLTESIPEEIPLVGRDTCKSCKGKWMLRLLRDARRVSVNINELTSDFASSREDIPITLDRMFTWEMYQSHRQKRHYWGRTLLCNFDWEEESTAALKRLFTVEHSQGIVLTLSLLIRYN